MHQNNANWKCPYCQVVSMLESENHITDWVHLDKSGSEGYKSLFVEYIVCKNSECQKYTCSVWFFDSNGQKINNYPYLKVTPDILIKTWNLKPESKALTFPDYIPSHITEDYNEACLILNGSPKASATLSRRCLQSMIRDFWKIKKNTLNDEIQALEGLIDPDVWKAIDAVRKFGNIGAHLKVNINEIINVAPGEAELLTELIEDLIEEWYIKKHEKEIRLKKIVDMAKPKTIQSSSNTENQKGKSTD